MLGPVNESLEVKDFPPLFMIPARREVAVAVLHHREKQPQVSVLFVRVPYDAMVLMRVPIMQLAVVHPRFLPF